MASSVQVFCRFRPLSGVERATKDEEISKDAGQGSASFKFVSSTGTGEDEKEKTNEVLFKPDKWHEDHHFTFDRIFEPEAGQAQGET